MKKKILTLMLAGMSLFAANKANSQDNDKSQSHNIGSSVGYAWDAVNNYAHGLAINYIYSYVISDKFQDECFKNFGWCVTLSGKLGFSHLSQYVKNVPFEGRDWFNVNSTGSASHLTLRFEPMGGLTYKRFALKGGLLIGYKLSNYNENTRLTNINPKVPLYPENNGGWIPSISTKGEKRHKMELGLVGELSYFLNNDKNIEIFISTEMGGVCFYDYNDTKLEMVNDSFTNNVSIGIRLAMAKKSNSGH